MSARDTSLLPTLVAVHGRKRSGKGTIAEHLASAYGYGIVKFSDPLKEMVGLLLAAAGIDAATAARCIESDLKEVPVAALGGKSTRYVMQIVGTEARDAIYTGMWSNIAVARIRAARAAGGRVVLDDLRFPHEIDVLRAEGATLWLVSSQRAEPIAVESEIPTCLREGELIDLDGNIEGMVALLLRHCGAQDASRLEAIGALGGRTLDDCVRAFRQTWLPLMLQPSVPSPVATAGHTSERPLPAEVFSAHLRNDGTIQELHAEIEQAIHMERQRSAA